jgi:DNA-directed RNA polymerase
METYWNILEVAADPMGAIREWWCAADKPFQFLAFCFDYASYMENRSHKSHLICAIDATCSGLQHWSAVLSDEKGAGRVGMVPKPEPDDIYQAVADRVEVRIKDNDDPIAVAWRGKVTRTITKRNVMTKLYGATMPGMRDQVLTELEKLDKKNGSRYLDDCPVDNYKAADFISRENDAAMRDIIEKATEGMDFVQGVARTLAKAGCPTSWKSPAGLPIDQTYWETKKARVETYWLSVKISKTAKETKKRGKGQRVRLNISYAAPEKGIQERKAANSIAPNFIHSMDASHLMFISLGWNKAFTPIHDSFGTHASDLMSFWPE